MDDIKCDNRLGFHTSEEPADAYFVVNLGEQTINVCEVDLEGILEDYMDGIMASMDNRQRLCVRPIESVK